MLAVIEHVAAAVRRPAFLAVLGARRLLLAQAHRLDLVFARAKEREHLLHAVGAPLAQADVVLAAAALVGIALDEHLRRGVLAQKLRVRLDDLAVLVLDVVLVVLEIDRAPREDVVRVLERGERRAGAGLSRLDASDARLARHGLGGGSTPRLTPLLERGAGLRLGGGGTTREDQARRRQRRNADC